MRDKLLNGSADDSLFDQHGMFKADQITPLPVQSNSAEQHYLQRYVSVFPAHALADLRIVFFEYSAVGRDLLPTILRNAGAEVICMGRSDEFFPIDTEALADQHLDELSQIVLKARAKHGKIDALVSTDGDSDRPLVIAVDETADSSIRSRFISGDLLGLLVTDYLGVDSISVPISSNPAIQEHFENKTIPVCLTKIGSPYVIEAMQQATTQGKKHIVAWEANGGYLTGSDLALNAGVIHALPTRDAILPILCLLHASVQQQRSLSNMIDRLPSWYGKAGLLDDFPKQSSLAILQQLTPDHDANICSVQFEMEQVIFRNADNQIIEQHPFNSELASKMISAKRLLESVFSVQHGFGMLTQINCLDGIRCYFDNEDIAHIRPSGNAPQLRIYAYARTQQRADDIVSLGIEEPAGLLRQLAELVNT
jgi:phosphomannomutase